MLTNSDMPSVFRSELCSKLLKVPSKPTSFCRGLPYSCRKSVPCCYPAVSASVPLLGTIQPPLICCAHIRLSKPLQHDSLMLVKPHEKVVCLSPRCFLTPSPQVNPKNANRKNKLIILFNNCRRSLRSPMKRSMVSAFLFVRFPFLLVNMAIWIEQPRYNCPSSILRSRPMRSHISSKSLSPYLHLSAPCEILLPNNV